MALENGGLSCGNDGEAMGEEKMEIMTETKIIILFIV